MDYKCRNKFVHSSGKMYRCGDTIDKSTYNMLSLREQKNFEKEENKDLAKLAREMAMNDMAI